MKVKIVTSDKKARHFGMFGIVRMATAIGMVGLSGIALGGGASAMRISDGLRVNPDYEKYIQDVKAGNGSNWNLIPEQYVADVVRGGKGGSANLPAQFSLKDNYATTLKNQGGDGICWAYAMTTAIESNLKKTQGIDVEFSPKQLDYLMASTKYAKYVENSFGTTRELGSGYNFTLGSIGLRSQYAPTLENVFFAKMQANDSTLTSYDSFGQYNDYGAMLGFGPYDKEMSEASILQKADYAVTGFKHYFGNDADVVAKVKQSIYENGAAYVGSYAPETENCWDAETKTIIDRGLTVCGSENGHAMAVIGWDDNHTYTDPSDGATKTGAFLIQNSWGKSSLFDDYQVIADKIMTIYEQAGMLDDLTEEEIANEQEQLVNYIANYDAEEYVYLGYDFDDSVDFGAITNVVRNDYENVYDVTSAISAITENEGVAYTWGIDGDEEISAVSLGILVPLTVDSDFQITIKGENDEITKKVHFAAGESDQQFIELDNPLWVSDKVDVVVESDKLAITEEDKGYFQISVYAEGGDIVVPNTGEIDVAVPNTAAPNTGTFVGDSEFSKFGGVIAAAVMLAVGIVGGVMYKNRKHLFHKVGFGKKGF